MLNEDLAELYKLLERSDERIERMMQ